VKSEVEWISYDERLPTAADASYEKDVIVAFSDGAVGWEPWDIRIPSSTHAARFPSPPPTCAHVFVTDSELRPGETFCLNCNAPEHLPELTGAKNGP